MSSNTHDHVAYALGYYHGRAIGVEDNPYDSEDEARYYYRLGYDAGVADYCHENHPEDEEVVMSKEEIIEEMRGALRSVLGDDELNLRHSDTARIKAVLKKLEEV